MERFQDTGTGQSPALSVDVLALDPRKSRHFLHHHSVLEAQFPPLFRLPVRHVSHHDERTLAVVTGARGAVPNWMPVSTSTGCPFLRSGLKLH